MSTGDKHAVYWMYWALLKCDTEGLVPSMLRDQLGSEYSMKIEEGDESKSSLAAEMSSEEMLSVCTQLGMTSEDLLAELLTDDQL